jgi:thiol:disulfide interchange protein DsbC
MSDHPGRRATRSAFVHRARFDFTVAATDAGRSAPRRAARRRIVAAFDGARTQRERFAPGRRRNTCAEATTARGTSARARRSLLHSRMGQARSKQMDAIGTRAAALVLLGACGAAQAGEAEVRKAVQAMLPQATIESLAPSSAPGYYEVVAQGQVIYVSTDGKHLMAGDLWQVEDRANLTAQRKDGIRHDAIDKIDPAQRIVFAADQPRHKVTVLTDFDCGYCQRLHQDIAQYNERGITVEYLLYPRGGLNSPSFAKAVSVWCAVDRKQAFTLAKAGTDPAPATCPNAIADNYGLVQRIGGIHGTPAVIDEHGKLTGYQPPEQMVAWLEGRK